MKKFFIFLILIIICGFLLWREIYLPREPDSVETKIFSIEKGEGSKEIALNLEKAGLIKWSPLFRFYALFKGIFGSLQAGTYELSPSMTIPEITEKLVSGEVIRETITIVEGWNIRDIADYLESKGLFQKEEFFEFVGFPMVDYSKKTDLPKPRDFSWEFPFLGDKPRGLGLEGYLFPDTYEIKKEEGLEDIVRKILQNLDKKLSLHPSNIPGFEMTPDLKNDVYCRGKTIFEVITMASLLEKEVQTLEDKKLVSGILWKRLENKIPLQVDATITYITGKRTTKISIEETRTDSPYNTYKYLGLPQGPICNPGLESILAALYPKDSEHWYYLSSPDGETHFSSTLEEHNIKKAKYFK